MTPPGRCHPSPSRPPARLVCSSCESRAAFSIEPTGAAEDRSETLNRERPHFRRFASQYGGSLPVQLRRTIASAPDAIESDALTVLGGVKGARACARRLRRP